MKIDFFACLIFNYMTDEGDYDREDEYIPYYTEKDILVPISYCPICGDKIEIVIERTKDVTEEYLNLVKEINLLNKNTKKKDRKRLEELYKKYNYYYTSE